ncbi:ribosomal RNA small subunit methyltransferase I [Lachnospiraceae bacterium]|nr:ribosomal RNA small subunit methyltransferase I [Lachnospiraceae bacterium]
MTGTLYLCATPIGNLGDMTFRVLDTLREVDLIAAEDTRNSIKLLNHFEIKTPMTSYHEYNRVEKAQQIIGWLKEGKNVALVSDAGTPAISDPGEVLVEMCQREGVPVTSLPGCCACITALTLSGLSTRRFCFEGFLPADKKEKKFVLSELARETRTIILYEAPHHLKRTLGELYGTLGERRVTLCRELTKRFETVIATTLQEAIAFYEENQPRGEYVLVLEGMDRGSMEREEKEDWGALSLEEHMGFYVSQGMEKKAAMKMVASDRGISKREVYQALLGG